MFVVMLVDISMTVSELFLHRDLFTSVGSTFVGLEAASQTSSRQTAGLRAERRAVIRLSIIHLAGERLQRRV